MAALSAVSPLLAVPGASAAAVKDYWRSAFHREDPRPRGRARHPPLAVNVDVSAVRVADLDLQRDLIELQHGTQRHVGVICLQNGVVVGVLHEDAARLMNDLDEQNRHMRALRNSV